MKSVIVLCGGMSRRMGQDKGSMNISNKPMILHILEKLNHNIDEVIIVLNDSLRIAKYCKLFNDYYKKDFREVFTFNIKFVQDEIKDKGPLSGIKTGLENITSNKAIVCPCDGPYIEIDYINYLFNIYDDQYDCISPYHKNNNESTYMEKLKNCEPLHSLYKKEVSKYIDSLLKEDSLKVKSLIKLLNTHFVLINQDTDHFKNFNRKEDIF